jgi:acyl carrier protein
MNNVTARVTACFANVFPDIRPEEIERASTASLTAWDSIAHITLLSAISEEFGVDFAPEEFQELVSFRSIVDYLEKQPG